MPEKSLAQLWGAFLCHEKLDPVNVNDSDVVKIIDLTTALVEYSKASDDKFCPYRSYTDRLYHRRVVCYIAMDMGMDLLEIKSKWTGKKIIGRGLLDMWNTLYGERFGSTVGTSGEHEVKRRGVSTKLAKLKREEFGCANPRKD